MEEVKGEAAPGQVVAEGAPSGHVVEPPGRELSVGEGGDAGVQEVESNTLQGVAL